VKPAVKWWSVPQGIAKFAPRKKRKRRVNFARLNHILIPKRSDQRDRFRRGFLGLLILPFIWLRSAFTREGRALLGISFMVGVAGLDVGNSQVYLLWAALSGLLIGSVLVRRLYGMRGAKLKVVAPRRATAREAVHFDIEIESELEVRAIRVETPFLPWDGVWLGRPPGIATVSAGSLGRSRASARFVERGEHHLDPFSARAMVPFGLAAGPAVTSGSCRFLVLPRMARMAGFELAQGSAGDRKRVASHVLGPSGDLAGVRPYRPGDPIRQLHARTWARSGSPHVREHVRERSERAGLVLLVDRGSDEKLGEAAISLAAGAASVLAHGIGGLGLVALGSDIGRPHQGASPGAILDSAMDRLAVYQVPAAIDATATIATIVAQRGDLSSVIVVSAEHGETPLELPGPVAALVEELERAGLGVRVLLVVEGDAVPERGQPVARIGRAAVDGEAEIAI